MKGSTRFALAATLLVGTATADAQQGVTLQFRDAHVTLNAQNVPVRQILAEWARIGGTRIVNEDKVTGAAVTLDLVDVLEREALDIVLRNASGYVLAMRQPATPDASAIDRILILPTSAAPRNPPPVNPAPAPVNRPVARQVVQPPVSAQGDDSHEQPEQARSEPPTEIPTPMIPRPITPIAMPPDAVAPPQVTQPAQPGTTPGNPFGVPRGSGLPGVVTPVPVEPPKPTPRPPERGPGSTAERDGPR